MGIVGLVGFAGVVVFGLLYMVFFIKGASLKIPVIGLAVFVLVLAAAVILPQMGITLPGSSTADKPSESAPAGGESSDPTPTPAPESESMPTPVPAEASTPAEAPTPTSAGIPTPAPTPAPAEASTPAEAPTPTSAGIPTPAPTPTPAGTPTPAPAEEFKRILTGKWSNARRDFWGDGAAIFISSFEFTAAGEIRVYEPVYVNEHSSGYAEAAKENGYDWGGDEYGWFIAPMGHTSGFGTYALTARGNGRFAVEANIFWPIAPSDYLEQNTYELTYVNDNTILINGVTYVRGSGYTLAEYARIFGFDIEF